CLLNRFGLTMSDHVGFKRLFGSMICFASVPILSLAISNNKHANE
uniref:Uncharacterized protein n=1 Tax=Aegilops tauschii subsp. strangulata TaxID=200361 RepID=A0A453RCT1_AEGTS